MTRVDAPPPAQVRVEAPRVDVAPVINVPPPALPARADADPLPEIQRLGAQIRADVDAYGAEQRERNEGLLAELRRNQEQAAAEQAAFILEQQGVNQAQRERLTAQDAQYAAVQERLGMNEVEMGRARDAVIAEINAAEARLRQAAAELDNPVNYDDVILRAVDEAVRQGLEEGTPEALRRRVPIEEVEEATPTPRQQERVEPEPERVEAEPEEPSGIEGVIVGGGELDLPNVVVERPAQIEPDESLRLSPEDPGRRPGAVVQGIDPETGRPFTIQRLPGTAGPTTRRAGGGGPLRAERPVEELQQELEQLAGRSPRLQAELEATQEAQQEEAPARPPTPESEELEDLRLQDADPVNVADALRLSRLALGEAAPDLALEEADDPDVGPELARLRLTDTQDFLAGFDAPAELQAARAEREQLGLRSPRRSPRSPRSPLPPILGGAAEADEALQALLREEPPTPSPTPRARSPRRAGGQTPRTPVQRVQEQLQREAEPEGDEPRPGQVAEGIAQFGGAARPAPPRVIEDAGIVALPPGRIEDVETPGGNTPPEQQAQLRELDPEVLFEPVEEAEEVGQVQDNRPQVVRDSANLYSDALPDLAANVRTGPQGARGQRGGVGYRLRNNTDKKLKKVEPGDVVNIIGVEAGARGEGRFRLDTQTAAGTRVSADQLGPLIDDGSFLFKFFICIIS